MNSYPLKTVEISYRLWFAKSIIALLVLTSTLPVRAQITQFDGPSLGAGFVSIILSNSAGSQQVDNINFNNVTNSGTLDTTLNASALTLTYNSVSIYTGGASGSVSGPVTTGFGQSRTITANVTFNPLSFSLSNIGTVSLTPTTGGNYNLSSESGTATLDFSGSYSITDGTNSYLGTFSTPITTGYTLNYFNADTLYGANYPNSIEIGYSGVSTFRFYDFPPDAVLFSQVFGSTNVQIMAQTVDVQTGNFVTLYEAPEPTTPTLLLGGLLIFGFLHLHRRMNRPAQA